MCIDSGYTTFNFQFYVFRYDGGMRFSKEGQLIFDGVVVRQFIVNSLKCEMIFHLFLFCFVMLLYSSRTSESKKNHNCVYENKFCFIINKMKQILVCIFPYEHNHLLNFGLLINTHETHWPV